MEHCLSFSGTSPHDLRAGKKKGMQPEPKSEKLRPEARGLCPTAGSGEGEEVVSDVGHPNWVYAVPSRP